MRLVPKANLAREFAALVIMAAIALGLGAGQSTKKDTVVQKADLAVGKDTFLRYCASCHGVDAKGNGPAAPAMKISPPDLTELSKRNDGKFPTGYVGALLKFGRNLASHGSQEMPVWGSRFKQMDSVHDVTGQKHVDSVVAYLESLQAK